MKVRGLPVVLLSLAACHSSSPSGPTPAPIGKNCTLAVPSPPDWRLHADGTLFKDSLGRVVLLRGVDAGGRSKFAPYVPFDYAPGAFATALASYMDHAAHWGIDAMRVPFTWAALEPAQPGQQDADWLSRYDQILDAAWARGIWTVIDFHQDIYSEVFCGDGFPAWTVPDAGAPHHDCASWGLAYYQDNGVKAAFDRFWAAGSPLQAQYLAAWDVMIARYKDRPGVVGFEPINEPGWGTADESTFTGTTLTAFYSAMVPHFRAAAPSSLVFVDPPGIDGAFDSTNLGRPTGDGVVFAPHYYPVGGANTDLQAGLKTWADIGTTWNVPVFLGEFGAPDTNTANTDYMSGIFDALDALGMSGTEWEYSVESELWNQESFSLTGSDGGDYPVAQAVQRPYARAVAGSGIAQSFDTTTAAFTLSYAPASGVTEVAVPAGAYPAGYTVTVLNGACVDAKTAPGRLLLQADPGATAVSLKIAAK